MLSITGLSVEGKNHVMLLNEICFGLKPGDCIGLTGASGAGKTTLVKTIMGILDESCRVTGGDMILDGSSMLTLTPAKRRELCGTMLGFIPQNPMTAFYHHVRIGTQMSETFRLRLKLTRSEAHALAENTLKQVNLTDTERILHAYPGQLSGGMLQRVTMAILWGLKPHYILADEPTSALDEVNRDHLLKQFESYPEDSGILFLSHDVTALKTLCREIMVMENGRLIERGSPDQIFTQPASEWTKQFAARAGNREGGGWEWTAS